MKFMLFGTGEYYNRYKIWFTREDIIALIDNSKDKQGQYIDDVLVIPPEDVFQYEFDVIIILSFYVRIMKLQLTNLGVEESRIYHFFDLHDLICKPAVRREVRYYGLKEWEDKNCRNNIGNNRKNNCKSNLESDRKILLLSNDLTMGGPAIALYHAAQILIKRGLRVVYGSMLDGPLRKILTGEGIPVIVDENLMIQTMDEVQWVKKYSFIICNTMSFHVFLSERDKRIPIAWWLHDALFFYDGVRQEVLDKHTQDNMAVWSVGSIPERAIKAFRPDFYVKDLIYGVTDQAGEEKEYGAAAEPVGLDERQNKEDLTDQTENKSEKKKGIKTGGRDEQNVRIRFITIGYIEHRKGQDILLKAIKSLEPDVRQKAEFIFVGQNTSLLAKELIETAGEIPEITFTGPVDRSKIDSLLGRSDMLVCPSREDPMPTVAAEAMMHKVPCLVSDTTGTVKYIRDGIDGLIFQSENAEQLKEILERCVRGEFDLGQMGRNARNVYEEYFSMEAFENRFLELIANRV